MNLTVRLRTVGTPSRAAVAPLLVVLDGPDYVGRGRLLPVLRGQVETGKLPAHRVALVDVPDRFEAYSASARFERTLAAALEELGRARRVALGSSLGALALLHAQRLEPRLFTGLFLQSGSFFRRRTDPQERGFQRFARIDRFVGGVLRGGDDARPVPTIITCALEEENYANNAVLAQALAAQGYPVDFHAARGGHDWPTWRRALAAHLPPLLWRVWR